MVRAVPARSTHARHAWRKANARAPRHNTHVARRDLRHGVLEVGGLELAVCGARNGRGERSRGARNESTHAARATPSRHPERRTRATSGSSAHRAGGSKPRRPCTRRGRSRGAAAHRSAHISAQVRMRHKCGTSAAQWRNFGTTPAQLRHNNCDTTAAQLRSKCGASAEQVRIACGSRAERVNAAPPVVPVGWPAATQRRQAT